MGTDENGQPYHDDCHAKGTFILTDKGEVPIEKIRPGDKVLTRDGYKRVMYTSKRVKECINKFGFNWSPDHPIITPRGKAPLCDIDIHDTIYTWSQSKSPTRGRSITDTPIQKEDICECTIGTMEHGKSRQSRFTHRFGKTLMGKCLKGMLSTIRTATHSIMTSLTLSALRSDSTWRNIMQMLNGQKELDRHYLRGVGIDECGHIPVSFVKKSSNLRTRLALDFVQGCVVIGIMPRWARTYTIKNAEVVIDLSKLVKRKDSTATSAIHNEKVLYAIGVEDKHEYFADGVLVSNTIAARWCLCLSLDMRKFKGYYSKKEYDKISLKNQL